MPAKHTEIEKKLWAFTVLVTNLVTSLVSLHSRQPSEHYMRFQ